MTKRAVIRGGVTAALVTVLAVSYALAGPKSGTLAKPIYVTITFLERSEKVSGSLLRFDENKVYVHNGVKERAFRWSELSGQSQHSLRVMVNEKKTAADWLELAELAVRFNMREVAQTDVAQAAKLDPAAREKGNAILQAATTRAAIKFQKPTPEENARALEQLKKYGTAVALQMKLEDMGMHETPHFLIFTDFEARDLLLLEECEAAYAAVSKQFDIPVAENVFVGKLPIFLFAKEADFRRFGKDVDKSGLPDTVLGYFQAHTNGGGHMAMYSPDRKKYGADAEKLWRRTLTHEFTHAFVARYRTNRQLPRWLDEGIAETVANGRFPFPWVAAFAREQAKKKFDFKSLFDDAKHPGGDMYPVMQTMVEAMLQQDRKAFLQMVNDIKDGVEPESAMRRNFKADYGDWEKAWRRYAKGL